MSDNTLRTVNYRVIQNAAASRIANKEVYTAQVAIKEKYSLAALTERMVAEGCIVDEPTIELVIKKFAKLVQKLVAEGRSVNISGLVRFAPAIRGTFETPDAAWKAANNAIVVNASTGSEMRIAAARSSVNRVDKVALPKLEQLVDIATKHSNVITSEGSFLVTGEQLTWDISAEDEGWFLNYGGDENKCEAIESEQDPECAVLRTTAHFEEAGLPLELFFRTRINGQLHQVKYDSAVVTATAAE